MSKFKYIVVLALYFLFSGCATFMQTKVISDNRSAVEKDKIPNVKIVVDFCRPKNGYMTLYTDEKKRLWLACLTHGTNFGGEIIGKVRHFLYIGRPINNETDFKASYIVDPGEIPKEIGNVNEIPLASCTDSRRYICADSAETTKLGYYDFLITYTDYEQKNPTDYVHLSSITYSDLNGRTDKLLNEFYSKLDGRKSGIESELPFERELKPLVSASMLIERINKIDTVRGVENVQAQLKNAKLLDIDGVSSALIERTKSIKLATFRGQKNFDGYSNAYGLSQADSDFQDMMNTASEPTQKSAVFAVLLKKYNDTKDESSLKTAERFIATNQDKSVYFATLVKKYNDTKDENALAAAGRFAANAQDRSEYNKLSVALKIAKRAEFHRREQTRLSTLSETALMKEFKVAKGIQKEELELFIISKYWKKLALITFKTKGGKAQAYGGGTGLAAELLSIFGENLGAKTSTTVNYKLQLDPKLFAVSRKYKYTITFRLHAKGEGERKRGCGLFLLSTCTDKLTESNFSASSQGILVGNKPTSGSVTIDWEPKYAKTGMQLGVSGGSLWFRTDSASVNMDDLTFELSE